MNNTDNKESIRVQQKETGSFYTCLSIADYIAKWAIDKKDIRVLEPSFGDGNFIYSAISRFKELGQFTPQIYGVELQSEPFYKFTETNNNIECFLGDFMDFKPDCKMNAVIGNPPYVRLRNQPKDSMGKVISLMNKYGINMPTSGSLWMPFIIHATEMLKANGKLGFVLPYEITYVRYAFNLWSYLKKNYGKLSIYRVYNDFFPEVDVETIVFLAEEKGSTTDKVEYKTFMNIADLFCDRSVVSTTISISDIVSLNKPFEQELISPETKDILLSLREKGNLVPLLDECKFKIGYVCGNKSFFHPTGDIVEKYKIDSNNLVPCLLNSKDISSQDSMGLDTANTTPTNKLFYPITIGKGEERYISYGEENKVNLGYKCKTRTPWYITPNIEIPDVILTVFGDMPRMITNSKGFAVSNSLLCGIIDKAKVVDGKELVCKWYNSLTLLLIEVYIHSLGGGSFVFIPGEMDKMEILSKYPRSEVENVFAQLNKCILTEGVEGTYLLGDELVLKNIYNFTDAEITKIRTSLDVLRSWRKPELRRMEL